jgi:hypothetical protein
MRGANIHNTYIHIAWLYGINFLFAILKEILCRIGIGITENFCKEEISSTKKHFHLASFYVLHNFCRLVAS